MSLRCACCVSFFYQRPTHPFVWRWPMNGQHRTRPKRYMRNILRTQASHCATPDTFVVPVYALWMRTRVPAIALQIGLHRRLIVLDCLNRCIALQYSRLLIIESESHSCVCVFVVSLMDFPTAIGEAIGVFLYVQVVISFVFTYRKRLHNHLDAVVAVSNLIRTLIYCVAVLHMLFWRYRLLSHIL